MEEFHPSSITIFSVGSEEAVWVAESPYSDQNHEQYIISVRDSIADAKSVRVMAQVIAILLSFFGLKVQINFQKMIWILRLYS